MAKKLLITGAEGQLGKALQFQLADHFDILSTTLRPSEKAIKNRKIHKLDVSQKENVTELINTFTPDIIINCAAYTNVDGCEKNREYAQKVNVKGLQNLIQSSDKNTLIILRHLFSLIF